MPKKSTDVSRERWEDPKTEDENGKEPDSLDDLFDDPQPQLQEHPPEPKKKELPKEILEIDVSKAPPLRIKIKKGRKPQWELN